MNKLIVFNALQTSLSGGIGRYSYELAKQLYLNNKNIKIVIREEDLGLFEFTQNEDLIVVKNIKNSKQRNYYEQFKLPQLVYRKFPEAIIHYPDSMAPLLAKNKVIITIHDLAFKSLKNVFRIKTVMWKNLITKLSIKKAYKIIAITNFTKEEIIRHYNYIDSSKIKVVYNGFNNFSKDRIIDSNIKNDIKVIKKPYILTVSTISPRKNVDGIIRAFDKIKDTIKEDLVIAGNNGWMYEDVFELVRELNIQDRVKFTGRINDDELKFLYKNSNLFIYASFYEGFGLPPLEAMSYNIPCIVSNTSSLPEVVGESAELINPKSFIDISDAITNILTNSEYKEILIEKGKIQTLKFSWEKCAQQTYDNY